MSIQAEIPVRQKVEYQKFVNSKLTSRFFIAEERVAQVDSFLIESQSSYPPHGNSKPVLIWGEIEWEVYGERIRRFGARPISDEDYYFASAKAASIHFGYKFNAVAQALAKAEERGEDVAMVGGVPLRRVDDAPGVD